MFQSLLPTSFLRRQSNETFTQDKYTHSRNRHSPPGRELILEPPDLEVHALTAVMLNLQSKVSSYI